MAYDLYIKDTGYLQTDLSGTKFTDEIIATEVEKAEGEYTAQDGGALLLKGITFNFARTNAYNSTPSASGKNSYVRAISFNLPTFTVSGFFSLKDITDRINFQALEKLSRTAGHKDIYFSTSDSTEQELITWLAPNYNNTASDSVTPYRHFNVFVNGLTYTMSADGKKVQYTLTLVITE